MALSISPRVDVLTINKTLKQVTEPIMRNRPIYAMLTEKKRIKYNQSGPQVEWLVRFRRNEVEDYDDLEGTTIDRVNRHKKCALGWGAFRMTEGITLIEREINKGPEAIIQLYGKLADMMSGDAVIGLEERLIHGTTKHSTTNIVGLEDFLTSGSAISGTIGYDANDTYAGLTTDLEDYGGSATAFPYGECDPEATFFTPILVDSASTNLTSDTKDWQNNFEEICSYIIGGMMTMQSVKPDVIVVTPDMYRKANLALQARATMNVDRGGSDNLAAKLGFASIVHEGVPITPSYGLPANTGYALCFDKMELLCLRGQLFSKETEEDLTVYSKIFDISFFGQQKIESPAFIGKIYPYSS